MGHLWFVGNPWLRLPKVSAENSCRYDGAFLLFILSTYVSDADLEQMRTDVQAADLLLQALFAVLFFSLVGLVAYEAWGVFLI